ncbi:MAG: DNA-formamidopyrimidine glycosylase family protein [Planctomycetota bacterium]
MPELPDVILYLESLQRLLQGRAINRVVLKSPFVLRTFDPPLDDVQGKIVGFSRIGKRIVWTLDSGIRLVFHLMIAGRFHWKKQPDRLPKSKLELMAFQFDHGTMMFTEASKKKRASLHVVAADSSLESFERGGLEVLEVSAEEFTTRLRQQNRTLKRALTDPTIFSGIGNAYSDEILLAAGLSPLKRTGQLNEGEATRLFEATVNTLRLWMERLREQNEDRFPEKVTAFRPEMIAHGKFNQPCAHCGTAIQRIRYAENECNYCPRCQTGGKLLADRSLSRLLKGDWPKTIDELEDNG